MQSFYKQCLLGIMAGVALIAVALTGCDIAKTTDSGVEGQETLPGEVILETPPAVETEGMPVEPGEAPSTPLIVHISMSKAPKLNEEVEVVLEVQAYRDAPGTTAQIELPPEAQLVSGTLHWEGDVKVGSPVQLTARIVFTQEGEYTIRGSALRPVSADMVWGDDDYIYLTVKQDAGIFGFETGEQPQLSTGPASGQDEGLLPGEVILETPPAVETEGMPVEPGEAPSTPLIVHISMSKAPKLNEEVEVVLEVQAYRDAPGTTAQIELPPEAQLVSGTLHWEGDVKVGSPVQLTARIVFTQEGEYTIRGSALRPVSADMVWGDDDYIYLTVKQDAGIFGFGTGEQPQLTTSPAPEKID